LEREGLFPLLFTREGGKGDELFNLFITTQPQNEESIKKPFLIFSFRIAVNDNANQTKHHK